MWAGPQFIIEWKSLIGKLFLLYDLILHLPSLMVLAALAKKLKLAFYIDIETLFISKGKQFKVLFLSFKSL